MFLRIKKEAIVGSFAQGEQHFHWLHKSDIPYLFELIIVYLLLSSLIIYFPNPCLQCFTIANSAVHDSNDEIERIDLGRDIVTWDDALRKSTQEYQHHSYNIFTCNCHSFVANGLNRLKFQAGGWNVVNLAVFIFLKGQWVSKAAIVRTYLPFIIVLALGLTFGGWMFLTYLATFLFVLVGWFFLGSYCFKKFINL